VEAVELIPGHHAVDVGPNFDLISFKGLEANHPYKVPVHILHACDGTGISFGA
jgi:hypothetical protein